MLSNLGWSGKLPLYYIESFTEISSRLSSNSRFRLISIRRLVSGTLKKHTIKDEEEQHSIIK